MEDWKWARKCFDCYVILKLVWTGYFYLVNTLCDLPLLFLLLGLLLEFFELLFAFLCRPVNDALLYTQHSPVTELLYYFLRLFDAHLTQDFIDPIQGSAFQRSLQSRWKPLEDLSSFDFDVVGTIRLRNVDVDGGAGFYGVQLDLLYFLLFWVGGTLLCQFGCTGPNAGIG